MKSAINHKLKIYPQDWSVLDGKTVKVSVKNRPDKNLADVCLCHYGRSNSDGKREVTIYRLATVEGFVVLK